MKHLQRAVTRELEKLGRPAPVTSLSKGRASGPRLKAADRRSGNCRGGSCPGRGRRDPRGARPPEDKGLTNREAVLDALALAGATLAEVGALL